LEGSNILGGFLNLKLLKLLNTEMAFLRTTSFCFRIVKNTILKF